ncbi:hypothetical protein SH501x_000480 [Pirellulaceae bacterium SH501]
MAPSHRELPASGIVEKNFLNASKPPAEATFPTIGNKLDLIPPESLNEVAGCSNRLLFADAPSTLMEEGPESSLLALGLFFMLQVHSSDKSTSDD